MSVSKWAYTPEMCDGEGCPGDCDLCDKPKNMEDEDDMTDYIKRKDAIQKFAGVTLTEYEIRQNAEENWDKVEVVRCKDFRNRGKTLCPIAFTFKELTEEMDYCSFGERADA